MFLKEIEMISTINSKIFISLPIMDFLENIFVLHSNARRDGT
jgi:hypothetical protein